MDFMHFVGSEANCKNRQSWKHNCLCCGNLNKGPCKLYIDYIGYFVERSTDNSSQT